MLLEKKQNCCRWQPGS